jgi:hypothetical protein
MKLIIAFLLIGLTSFSYGQEKGITNFLLVRIDAKVDVNGKSYYYVINAESNCDAAAQVYALIKYNDKKNAVNDKNLFYYKEKDTVNNLYNYFVSPTEALNFLSRAGWTLFNIYTETFSGYDNQKNGTGESIPITTVSSRPVYCFKNDSAKDELRPK